MSPPAAISRLERLLLVLAVLSAVLVFLPPTAETALLHWNIGILIVGRRGHQVEPQAVDRGRRVSPPAYFVFRPRRCRNLARKSDRKRRDIA